MAEESRRQRAAARAQDAALEREIKLSEKGLKSRHFTKQTFQKVDISQTGHFTYSFLKSLILINSKLNLFKSDIFLALSRLYLRFFDRPQYFLIATIFFCYKFISN